MTYFGYANRFIFNGVRGFSGEHCTLMTNYGSSEWRRHVLKAAEFSMNGSALVSDLRQTVSYWESLNAIEQDLFDQDLQTVGGVFAAWGRARTESLGLGRDVSVPNDAVNFEDAGSDEEDDFEECDDLSEDDNPVVQDDKSVTDSDEGYDGEHVAENSDDSTELGFGEPESRL